MQHVDIVLDTPSTLPPWGYGRLRAWWSQLPDALRAPMWPWSLAGLVIVALLVGFHHVVRDAVRQGEALRMSAATHAEAVWRCNTIGAARMRTRCLAQLDAPPAAPEDADTAPPNTAAVSLAGIGR